MIAPIEREKINPTDAEIRLAEKSLPLLAGALSAARKKSVSIRVQSGKDDEDTITIPVSALRLLNEVLSEMARGNAVALHSIRAELSTQEAADLLNVSRPFLVAQMERGLLPFHKVGKHRRVKHQDLMLYKQHMEAARLKSLEELSALDQELGLGY